MESISQRLRRIREASGLGGKRLSEICGLGNSHVRMIERGDVKTPDLRTVEKLAEKLGVSAPWLMFGVGEYPGDDAVKAVATAALEEFLAARAPTSDDGDSDDVEVLHVAGAARGAA